MKEVACLNEESVGICALPLFHVNAVIVTGLAPFMAGGTVLLPTPAGFRGLRYSFNFGKSLSAIKLIFLVLYLLFFLPY